MNTLLLQGIRARIASLASKKPTRWRVERIDRLWQWMSEL